jgi:hypothetical protein
MEDLENQTVLFSAMNRVWQPVNTLLRNSTGLENQTVFFFSNEPCIAASEYAT